MVRRLLGSYPSVKLHDPQIYMTELMALFVRYPAWVGEQGIVGAKKESPKFIPAVPEVEKACERAFGEIRWRATYADEWNARSKVQLEERAQFQAADKRK